MAMTPSQLSIIVKSQGVEKAAQDLEKLAQAASSVDAETKAFVIAQSKLADSNKKVSQSSEAAARGVTTQELAMIKLHESANRMNAVLDRQHAAQQKLVDNAFNRALKEQEVSAKKAEEALSKQNKELEKQSDALKKTSHHGSIFNNTLRSMTTAALAYMGVNFATGLFKSADAWASMQAKLSLATGSMNAAKVVQEDLYKISQNIRIPLEDTAKLYNRMVHPLMMMGKTSKDTTDMVSSMGYALKLSGATGQEAASAMLQFSQSMNAGRLNGGEFNSIAEASPNILRAIEAELVRTGRGAELSSQGLKKMAAEGQLTAKLVSEAMLRALPQWRKDFESLPLTVDGAITRIKNMWEKSIGNLAQDTGFAQNFTKLLGQLETVIPAFAKTIVSAFSLVIDYAGILLKSLAAIAAIGLANWAYTSFMAVQGLSVGMKAATLATNALAGSMALLQSSMMWFAGAAVGIGLIVKGYQELNKERMGLGEATTTLEDSHKKYIKELEAETSMLIKQVNLMREKRGESSRLVDPYEKSTAAKSEERINDLLAKKLDVQNKLAATQKEINRLQSSVGTGSDTTELARITRLSKLNDIAKEAKDSLARVAADELEEVGKKKMAEFAADKAQKESAIARTKEAENKLNQMTQFKQKAVDLYNETEKLAKAELAAGNISQKFYEEKIEAARKLRDTNSKEGKIASKAVADEQEQVKNLQVELAGLIKQKELILKLGIDGEKLLPSQRRLIEMELDGSSAAQVALQKKIVTAALAKKSVEDGFDAQRKVNDEYTKSLTNAQDELAKNEALLASNEKRVEVLAGLNAANQLKKTLSMDSSKFTQTEIEREWELYEILKKNADVVGATVIKDTNQAQADEAKKRLEELFSTSKVDKFESASSKALKGVAKGFVELNKAMNTYGVKQEKISQARRDNLELNYGDFKKFSEEEAKITEKEAEYKLASYGDMANAAKGFFEEGSKGYRTLDGISKVVHAAQLARNLVEMGQLAVKAVMNQASGDPYSAWARMGAMAAAMAALGFAVGGGFNKSSGGVSAADMQKAQGSGQRMDASTGKYVADGMSVFGDITAKSESIAKSLELLKSSYDKLYPVNQGMLKALKNIESSMSGLTNLVVRSGGIVEGSNLGIQEGTIKRTGSAATGAGVVAGTVGGMALGTNIGMGIGAIGGPIGMAIGAVVGAVAGSLVRLWGKTTQNIVDSGLQFGGNLAGLKSGKGFEQYASVNTTKSRAFGLFKETTNKVETDKLNNELSNQFAMIFSNMQTTLEEAGKALYGSSKGVTDALNNMVFEVSKVSLKGLSGQALTDAINGVISKALDQMAATAFTSLDKFESVIGEGYAQKVLRIANTFVTVNSVFDKLGMKMYEMTDAGIGASLSFVKLFDSMEEMQSVASSYYDNFYTEQEKQAKITEALRKQFAEMNLTLPTTSLAYRELVDSTTDPAKIATLWKLSDAFAEVFGTVESGIGGLKDIPQSMRDAFEALAESAERWLNLSKSAADLRGSINEILTGASDNSAKKAEKLWKMLESDISVEQKMSIAGELKDTILAKYQVERDSITKLLDLSRQLKNFVEGLKVGSMSPLTTTQKLEEAKKQYESILAKAKGGDTTAQGALQGSATTYLDLARTALASGTEYRTIFDEITTSLDMFSVDTQTAEERMVELNKSQETELIKLVLQLNTIESVADSYYKTNIAEMTKQLTVMQEMYIKLGNLDGIAVDLAKLPAEIAAVLAGKFGRTTGEQFIEGLYKQYTGKSAQEIDKQGMEYWTEELLKYGRDYTLKAFVDSVKPPPPVVSKPSDTTTILTNTVVQLKEEISALRDDQNKQTEALIAATVIANQQNATDVVEGVDDAYNKKNWRDVNAPALV